MDFVVRVRETVTVDYRVTVEGTPPPIDDQDTWLAIAHGTDDAEVLETHEARVESVSSASG